MNTTVVVALVVGLVPALGSLALAWLTGKQRREEKQLEWERQDKLNQKLNIIHDLVNSQMTAVLRQNLGALEGQQALMLEVIEIRRGATGHEPSERSIAILEALGVRVAEMEATLAEREKTQNAIDHLKDTEHLTRDG